MMGNLKLALIILLTGVVVVFAVLVLLILIIKLYSTAVSSAQNTIEARKVERSKAAETEKAEEKKVEAPEPEIIREQTDDGAIPLEVIAAIAAAVEVVFGEGAVKVTSVKRAKPTSKRRSAWKAAGVAENTRAF